MLFCTGLSWTSQIQILTFFFKVNRTNLAHRCFYKTSANFCRISVPLGICCPCSHKKDRIQGWRASRWHPHTLFFSMALEFLCSFLWLCWAVFFLVVSTHEDSACAAVRFPPFPACAMAALVKPGVGRFMSTSSVLIMGNSTVPQCLSMWLQNPWPSTKEREARKSPELLFYVALAHIVEPVSHESSPVWRGTKCIYICKSMGPRC